MRPGRHLLVRCLAAALLAVGIPEVSAQNTTRPELAVTRLSRVLYLLQGMVDGSTYGGNVVASVGPDGILLVDTEYRSLSSQVHDALAAIAGPDATVRVIINTPWHRDHTEGNTEFGRTATIVAHNNVRLRLSTPQTLFGQQIAPYPAYAQPVVTFEDALSLHFNGEDIRVVHVPSAHTDGDAIVFFETSNVLHTGDVYIGPVFPFIDLDHGGSVDGLERGVKTTLALSRADTTIVPGHRSPADTQALTRYEEMLTRSLEIVGDQIHQNRTLADIQDRGLPADWKAWEWEALPMRTWIEYVYRSLTTHSPP